MTRRMRVVPPPKKGLDFTQMVGLFLLTLLILGFAFLMITEPQSQRESIFSFAPPSPSYATDHYSTLGDIDRFSTEEEAAKHCERPLLAVGPDDEERGWVCPAISTP